jgi:hypothetical protein
MLSKSAKYISCQMMSRASKNEELVPRMANGFFPVFSQECPCHAGIHLPSSTSFSLPVLTS